MFFKALSTISIQQCIPESKVHGANVGPTWVLSAPDGPHVGPMNLAIRDVHASIYPINSSTHCIRHPHLLNGHSYDSPSNRLGCSNLQARLPCPSTANHPTRCCLTLAQTQHAEMRCHRCVPTYYIRPEHPSHPIRRHRPYPIRHCTRFLHVLHGPRYRQPNELYKMALPMRYLIYSSPLGQNGRHFADDIFKCIFVNEMSCFFILIEISLKFVPKCPVDNNPAMAKIMAWHRIGDKPLSDLMQTRFTDAYIRH